MINVRQMLLWYIFHSEKSEYAQNIQYADAYNSDISSVK